MVRNYAVRDREAGNIIEYVSSLEEGKNLIKEFEMLDKMEMNYTPNFYEVIKIEKEG